MSTITADGEAVAAAVEKFEEDLGNSLMDDAKGLGNLAASLSGKLQAVFNSGVKVPCKRTLEHLAVLVDETVKTIERFAKKDEE